MRVERYLRGVQPGSLKLPMRVCQPAGLDAWPAAPSGSNQAPAVAPPSVSPGRRLRRQPNSAGAHGAAGDVFLRSITACAEQRQQHFEAVAPCDEKAIHAIQHSRRVIRRRVLRATVDRLPEGAAVRDADADRTSADGAIFVRRRESNMVDPAVTCLHSLGAYQGCGRANALAIRTGAPAARRIDGLILEDGSDGNGKRVAIGIVHAFHLNGGEAVVGRPQPREDLVPQPSRPAHDRVSPGPARRSPRSRSTARRRFHCWGGP